MKYLLCVWNFMFRVALCKYRFFTHDQVTYEDFF
jgi:hypothetical protein